MSKDELGDRMKMYESAEAGRLLMPLLPVCARIDGRGFSGFTKGLKRPYDENMSRCMIETTKFLVEETNAKIGYTQSDEISLVWLAGNFQSQIFFGGKVQKMVSTLAALATVKFNSLLPEYLPSKARLIPTFDCRVWSVPNTDEAVNTFLWRELDATKNSVSMAARHYYSHKELDGHGRADQMDMLMEKGINWNDYPAFFKRGTYVQRKTRLVSFPVDKVQFLPLGHEYFTNPDLKVQRSSIEELDLPPLSKISNKKQVIFYGEEYRLVANEV